VKDKQEMSQTWASSEEPPLVPWSHEQVAAFRAKHPELSMWRVVLIQGLVGVVLCVLIWGLGQPIQNAFSCAYGVFCVVFPGLVFVRGLHRLRALGSVQGSLGGFFLWEFVKVLLTIALLALAPKVVDDLSWAWMILGLIVTLKSYWMAWFWLK
jgi:ATP synthase protein I